MILFLLGIGFAHIFWALAFGIWWWLATREVTTGRVLQFRRRV